MSQRTIVVMHEYLIRRSARNREDVWDGSFRDEDWEYQVWIITEIRPAEPEEIEEVEEIEVDSILQAAHATVDPESPGERLTEALAKSAADYIEGEIWRVWETSDDLPLDQAVNFLIGVSDSLREVVQNSLECLADDANVPAPVNLVGAEVMATLLTGPITEPIEEVEHRLEVACILVGLATGLHPLVMTGAKYLIHDEISSVLSEVIRNALENAFTSLERAFSLEFSTLPPRPQISDHTIAFFEESQRLSEPDPGQILRELTLEDESSVDSQNVIIDPVDSIFPPYEI